MNERLKSEFGCMKSSTREDRADQIVKLSRHACGESILLLRPIRNLRRGTQFPFQSSNLNLVKMISQGSQKGGYLFYSGAT